MDLLVGGPEDGQQYDHVYFAPELDERFPFLPLEWVVNMRFLLSPGERDAFDEQGMIRLHDADNGLSQWCTLAMLPFVALPVHAARLAVGPLPDIVMGETELFTNRVYESWPLNHEVGLIPDEHFAYVQLLLEPSDAGQDSARFIYRLADNGNGNARWCTASAWRSMDLAEELHPATIQRRYAPNPPDFGPNFAFQDPEGQTGPQVEPPTIVDADGSPCYVYTTLPLSQTVGYATQEHLNLIRQILDPVDIGHDSMTTMVRLQDDENGNAQWCTERAFPYVQPEIPMHPYRTFGGEVPPIEQRAPGIAGPPQPQPPAPPLGQLPGPGPAPLPGPNQAPNKKINLKWDDENRMRYVVHTLWRETTMSRANRVLIFNRIFSREIQASGFTNGFPLSSLASQANMRNRADGTSPAYWQAIMNPTTDQAELAKRATLDAAIAEARRFHSIP